MKAQARSMSALFWMMTLMLALIGGTLGSVSAQDPAAPSRVYLSLTLDPVVPGGVTAESEAQMLSMGWRKIALKRDVLAHVQFRNQERTYYQDGWLAKGTEVYVQPSFRLNSHLPYDFGVIRMCGNPVILGEELYGW